MSVQNEIDRIEQNVANTYAVLKALGADIPTQQNSDNLPTTAGTAKAVLYSEQNLTEGQKAQVRENIGALATFLGDNPTGGVDNDTVNTWLELGYGVAWISELNQVNDQPSQYGFIINYAHNLDVFQIFQDQMDGNAYLRCGDKNSSWFQSWSRIPTANGDGYVNVGGVNASKTITVSDDKTSMAMYTNGISDGSGNLRIDASGEAWFKAVYAGDKKLATEEYVTEKTTALSGNVDVVHNAVGTTYPPAQKPAMEGFDGYDIDVYNSMADDIHAYIDAVVSGKETVTKEIMGKDASGKYDVVRYIYAKRDYLAWVRDKYPKMYAWKNGNTIKYTQSVSPRIAEKAFDEPYLHMVPTGGSGETVTVPAKAIIYPGYRYSHSGGAFKAETGAASVIIPLPVGGVTSATVKLTNAQRHASYNGIYGGSTSEAFPLYGMIQATGVWSVDLKTATLTPDNYNLSGYSFLIFFIAYTNDAALANVTISLDGKLLDWAIGEPSEARQESTTTATGTLVPAFTNLKDQCVYKYGYMYSLSGGGYKALSTCTTVLVPVPTGVTDITVRLKGVTPTSGYSMVYGGANTDTLTEEFYDKFSSNPDNIVPDANGVYTVSGTKTADVAYLSFHIQASGAAEFVDTIITVNEPIEYTVGGDSGGVEVEGGTPITAVSASRRSRTIGGVEYVRYEDGDVEPTVIYTDKDDDRNDGATITKDGVTYKRYPLGDLGANRKKLIPMFIYANEHGVNPSDLYFSSESQMCALVLSRFLRDVASDKQTENPLYKFIRENCMLIVIPVANPYGFNMYLTGDANTSNDGYRNANNVNINRNYDTPGWDVTKANESYWSGSYAGSEIEAQYIMNTMVESGAVVAMSWHSAEWWYNSHQGQNPNPNTTGEDDKYVDYDREKLAKIEAFIKSNYGYNQRYYDLYTQAHVDAGIVSSDMIGKPYPCKNTPDVTSKSPSFISQCGAYGGIVEFSPGDITVGGTLTHKMSTITLENAYAFALNLTAMWLSDYLEA